MEEDIKILERLVEERELVGIYKTDEIVLQAIEYLIKAYKELEEENKTLNERNQYLVKYRAKLEKELYESNENYIPVSLVEEKIEEYQNNMKLYENETHNIFNENNIRQEVITVLQELLEKR